MLVRRNCMVFLASMAPVVLWGAVSVSQSNEAEASERQSVSLPGSKRLWNLYPAVYDEKPDVASPFTTSDGREIVVVRTAKGQYALVPVTVENAPLNVRYGVHQIGKGRQLEVDGQDFPTLARVGLHSEKELDTVQGITGRAVEQIDALGQPGSSSDIGFLGADEDIISVLKGDNRLVRRLGLTHPQLARPLFHVWNLILREYELGRIGRFRYDIQSMLYNGDEIRFGEILTTRGFQESIFDDEIQGAFQINFRRTLSDQEKAFLEVRYGHLSAEQMTELTQKLIRVLTAEMEPYYVMRYGFYEGHTGYRVDPIALAFIFGLRSLEEIEDAFPQRLYEVLTTTFTRDSLPNPSFHVHRGRQVRRIH